MFKVDIFKRSEIYAVLIGVALILMYGGVPWYLHYNGSHYVPWAEQNLLYSLLFGLLVLSLLFLSISRPSLTRANLRKASLVSLWIVFLVCAVVFYNFPWHDDRESAGASLAAVFRAVWVIYTFKFIRAPEHTKLLILFMTAVLVFIDQSRTYFFISFLVLSLSSQYFRTYMLFGFFVILLVAAIRVGEGITGFGLLTYGIIGEGYNGSKAVGQILEISQAGINHFAHIGHIIFQPLIFPFEFVAKKIIGFDFWQNISFATEVRDQLGETLSPMGGWYILADFISYGPLGLIFLWVYIFTAWKICKKLFDTYDFPFGSYLFLISIKASPFIFYKFIFYIYIIMVLMKYFMVFLRQSASSKSDLL
jgi:hypothetical protein